MHPNLFDFGSFWHHVEIQNGPQWGPSSLPNRSKIDLKCVFASRGRALICFNRFGADLGLLWEVMLEPKLVLEAILKAFAKRSLIWYPSEVDFGPILEGFWHLIGGQKQEVNSKEPIIADPSKLLIFHRKKHHFYYFERCPIAQKTSVVPSLEEPWWKHVITFRKIPSRGILWHWVGAS